MPKRARPNQRRKPRTENIATLVAEIEDALGGDDYRGALITVTEAVLGHIESARAACARILVEAKV